MNSRSYLFPRPSPAKIEMSSVGSFLRDVYGLKTTSIERIPTEKDDTFVITTTGGAGMPHFVFKIENPQEDPAAVELRAKAYRLLESSNLGLSAPRIKETLKAKLTESFPSPVKRSAILMSFLPGITLAKVQPPYSQALLEDVGSTLAHLQSALSDLPILPTTSADRTLWDVRAAEEIWKSEGRSFDFDSSRRALIETGLSSFSRVGERIESLPQSLCHGDFHPANIMVANSNPQRISSFLDLGDMHTMPVICDVGTCLFYFIRFGQTDPFAQCRQVLSGYLENRPLTANELSLLPAIFKARCLLTILIPLLRSRFTGSDGAGHYLASTSERLKDLKSLENIDESLQYEMLLRSTP